MYFIGELRDQVKGQEIVEELRAKGIEAEIKYIAKEDMWAIFVAMEVHVPMAQEFYRVKLGLKKPFEIEKEWVEIKSLPNGFMTMTILVVCLILYLLSYAAIGDQLYEFLMFSEIKEPRMFHSILNGEWWRVITPIFLHMNILHILFNMLWFKDLGNVIEYNFSVRFYLLFVLFVGLTSNLLQYIVQGPSFGGMSGVLYGMLGFLWVFKRAHANFSFGIPDRDMTIMLVWFVLCLTGFLGPIANLAHAGGLSAGMFLALGVERSTMTMSKKQQFVIFLAAVFILLATLVIEGFKLEGQYYILKNLAASAAEVVI